MKTEDIRLILASASPRRKELLIKAGFKPEVRPTSADETVESDDPEEIVKELAKRKCAVAAANTENGHVLGADTIVYAQGKILEKPADEEDAAGMLRLLSGKAHEVYTGVCLIGKKDGNKVYEDVFFEMTRVHVAALSDEEIGEYIATGEPMDKAGSYGIQGPFLKHVTAVEGDYFNVVGLPVAAVYSRLKERLENDH